MIYFTPDRKVAGEMGENGVYCRKVKREKHFMKIFKGYGISESIVNKLKEDGCKYFRIYEDDTMKYQIPFELFIEHSIRKDFGDPQLFCDLKWFESKPMK